MGKPVVGKLLVIPDAHAHPEYDNERFTWLGKFVLDTKPDIIVCLGDWADMPSLSSYDKGTRGFEGRRYKRDVDAAIDAQEKFFAPMKEYNRRRARNKDKQYKPRMVLCLGNHSDRINRVTNEHSELDGAISVDDLKFREYGWEVYPFKEAVFIHGIAFSHYFTSGVAGRPISGENIAKTMCNKLHHSAVQGHSHVLDHSERSVIDGKKIFGLSAGCYTHPDMGKENWCKDTAHLWWRGVVEICDLDGEGYYDQINMITMRKIKRDYA